MEIPIDADVICEDGIAGRVRYIVIDPVHQKVTHVVIAEARFPHIERMVPLGLVESSDATEIHLRCERSKLSWMEPFTEVEFLTDEGALLDEAYQERFYWPHVVPAEETVLPLEIERIPPGELAARRGMHVHAKDGNVGRIDEFLVDPANGHITHLVMREGHLWGQRDVTIPLSQIESIAEDGVYLKLDKDGIAALPHVPVRRLK